MRLRFFLNHLQDQMIRCFFTHATGDSRRRTRSRTGLTGAVDSASIEVLEERSMLSADIQLIDINTLPGGSSTPRSLTAIHGEPVDVNGTLFFTAFGPSGTELWKSDGTVGGTELVADICNIPDSQSSSLPDQLTNVNGTLFFVANDNIHGFELWKSDGTAQGTVMVRDISPGPDGSISAMMFLTAIGDKLYFARGEVSFGLELWVSDGTEAGTKRITDLAEGDFNSVPQNLTVVNDTLYFAATDAILGLELYKVDPLTDQVSLVKDIFAGETPSFPHELTNVNGSLFFVATDPVNGQELWTSDGTEQGTVLVKDLWPGSFGPEPRSSMPRNLVNFNGTLFFAAAGGPGGHELWKSNGTEVGTVMVKEVSVGFSSQGPEELTVVDDTLFFSGEDALAGYELWKSDGTTDGTSLVKDIRPLTFSGNESNPRYLTDVNGILYFTADDGTNGRAVWRSDGTTGGTQLVSDIEPGTLGFGPRFLTSLNGKLFFTANDGTNGEELWLLTPSAIEPTPNVTLSLSQTSVGEATGTTLVTATLSAIAATDVTIVLGTSGTAALNDDYSLTTDQIVILAGATTGSITLTAVQDSVDEINETIQLDILDVSNANEDGIQQVTVTITDDDAPPTVTLEISSTTIAEAGGTATVTARLSAVSSLDVTIELGLGGSANANDYDISNTQITIPAGSTTGIVTLTALQDSLIEEHETIVVDITSVSNGSEFGTQSATTTILTLDLSVAINFNPQPLTLSVSNKKPVAIDSTATITTNINPLVITGSVLRVSGHAEKDTISILKENGISAKGKKLVSGRLVIGSVSGGKKGSELMIQFSNTATQDSVQRVLRSLAFSSKDKLAGNRAIQIRITNIGGQNTNPATRQIQITN